MPLFYLIRPDNVVSEYLGAKYEIKLQLNLIALLIYALLNVPACRGFLEIILHHFTGQVFKEIGEPFNSTRISGERIPLLRFGSPQRGSCSHCRALRAYELIRVRLWLHETIYVH